MAYSTNPYLPKARAIALKLLIQDELPLVVVARKCGIHRSTLYRWRKKWEVLNKNVQMDNPNRPNRTYSKAHHLKRCTWRIPTFLTRIVFSFRLGRRDNQYSFWSSLSTMRQSGLCSLTHLSRVTIYSYYKYAHARHFTLINK